jgi:hypothetical protein
MHTYIGCANLSFSTKIKLGEFRHPAGMGMTEVNDFLTYLAVKRKVSAATVERNCRNVAMHLLLPNIPAPKAHFFLRSINLPTNLFQTSTKLFTRTHQRCVPQFSAAIRYLMITLLTSLIYISLTRTTVLCYSHPR